MAPGPIVTMVGQGALLGMVYAMVSSSTRVACWLLVSHPLLHTVLTSLCAFLYPLCCQSSTTAGTTFGYQLLDMTSQELINSGTVAIGPGRVIAWAGFSSSNV